MTEGAPSLTPLTAVLADDEPLARLHLRRLLEEQGITVIGEAEDAPTAMQAVHDLRPDLLFLDIQMPLLSGMHTAAALMHLDHAPLVIFVTGYSEYAAEAFDRDALDYVLKPASPERLARTLVRARQRLAADPPRRDTAAGTAIDRQAVAQAPLKRVPVRVDYAVQLVRLEAILYAEARQRSVYLHTAEPGSEPRRTYFSLTQLEALLPEDRFVRIHDSFLVNLDVVEELSFLGNHAYAVRLSGGQTLPVGRTRYAALRQRLGLDRLTS